MFKGLFIATQLNSTRLTYFALIGCTLFNCVICIADRRRQLSCVGEGVYSDATQLNSTRRRVELSCVAINGPLQTSVIRLSGSLVILMCSFFLFKVLCILYFNCGLLSEVNMDGWMD